ncbi:MAG: nucleotidyltransferase family protein [Dysgonomonas sp.]|nr:nucleotidyltransferase family protein [Dysgonomonas sp.]
MTNQMDMFFTLLRLSLHIDQNNINSSFSDFNDASSKDWEQLFDLSARQGVLLLSYGGLQHLPANLQPPRKLKLRWCVNVVKGSERYDHYKYVITKLSNLFSENNVGLLIIKGVTIAELYPVPYFRGSGDIDIYLLEKNERANNLISSFEKSDQEEISKHSTFFLEGIPIENHHTFFDTSLPFLREGQLYQKMENILNSMFFENTCPLLSWGNISQLPPQAAALYFIGHTFRHFCCLDINSRQMCDWTIFFNKYKKDIDCELLSSQINQLGLDDFVCQINSFCSTYLGFKPYFSIPQKEEVKKDPLILKIIMQYRVKPKVHIPVFGVLHYLFRRNNIYRKYLGKVSISEFLLPEIKSYFSYLLKQRWRSAISKKSA